LAHGPLHGDDFNCGGVWSFVSFPRLDGSVQRLRTALTAAEEKQETRLANATSLKEDIAQILQRYAESGDVSDMKSSYQQILDSGTSLSASLYNQALEAMATAGRPADAKEFLSFMEEKVEPNGATYDYLVKSYLKAGDHEEALKTLMSAAKPLLKTCKMTLESLLEVKKDFTSATRLMNCLPAMGLQPSYVMYKGMITAAAEEGNIETAEAWFQQLKADELKPESGLFVSLIKGCYKAKDSQNALRYFNLMQGADLKPVKGTYDFVIRSLAEEKEVDSALEWIDRMVEDGMNPSLELYEVVMEAAAKSKRQDVRRDLEKSWIRSLKVAKVKVDKEVYKTLIRVAARYGDISSAAEWLKKMKEARHACGVNEYNYLLKGCEYLKDADSAQKFFNRMEKASVEPDAESYNLIIKTLAKAGKPKLVEKWGKKMQKAGLLTSKTLQFGLVAKSIVFNSQNSADYAAKWVKRAVELEKPMDVSAYRAVMRAYLDEKNSSAARKWYDWMKETGTIPDYDTYLMLMKNDDRKTDYWHSEMVEAGVPPTTESFNLVIASFSTVKGSLRTQKVEEWYERMLSAGVAPNEDTYGYLIAASVMGGKKEETDRWFSKMVDDGLSPGRHVYQSLMMRSLMDRDPVAVRQILDWMVLKGISINKGAYNIAIRAFAEANEPENAEEMFRRLKVAGRYPDERSFCFIIEAHARQGSMSKARDWFNEMLKAKVRPGFRTYAALIRGYGLQGDVSNTKEFLLELELRKFHGMGRAAWKEMMLPALQCFKKAGDEEEVTKWMDYSDKRGFLLNVELEEAEAEVTQDKEVTSKPRSSKKRSRGKVKQDAMAELETLKAEGRTPDIRDFNKVMKEFGSVPQSRYSMAKAFLETTIMPAVKPNENTFFHLLRCNRRGDGKRGVYTIEWMREKDFPVRRSHTGLVVRRLFQDLVIDKVTDMDSLLERLLACMETKSQRSDLYGTIILQAAEEGLLKIANEWGKRARNEDLLMPAKTCYSMAKAHFKDGDEISSLWWIETAGKEKGSTPSARLGRFIDTVAGFGAGQYSPQTSERVDAGIVDRLATFMTRLSSDSTLSKEDVPYLNIIQAYSRAKRPQGAADWLGKMATAGVSPQVEAYNAVIRSYAEVGDSNSASQWLARLQAEAAPDFDSYQAVLDAYASNGDADKVQEIWKELTAAGFTATDQTYCSTLRAYCLAKDAKNVEVWVDRFEWEGIQFNWLAFAALTRFYLGQGELSKAFGLSEEMAMTDLFEVGEGLWLEQLEAAQKQNDASHAEKVATAMLQYGYGKQLPEKAKGILREMLGEAFFKTLYKKLA